MGNREWQINLILNYSQFFNALQYFHFFFAFQFQLKELRDFSFSMPADHRQHTLTDDGSKLGAVSGTILSGQDGKGKFTVPNFIPWLPRDTFAALTAHVISGSK